MALCSKTSTTPFLTRRHGDTEAVALHRTPSHDGAHDHCTEPKLRVSVAPCEPLLLMALCSKTSTTPFLTRRHGDTEAVALHRTPSHDGAHDHCTASTQCPRAQPSKQARAEDTALLPTQCTRPSRPRSCLFQCTKRSVGDPPTAEPERSAPLQLAHSAKAPNQANAG